MELIMIDRFECKDCGDVSTTAAGFSDHIRVCNRGRLPIPQAVLERRAEQEMEDKENKEDRENREEVSDVTTAG